MGPLMVDVKGLELNQEDIELLKSPAVGGVILFTRNYSSPRQLAALTEHIHSLRHPRLLIAVDQEGGRVQRFRESFCALPAAALFGQIYAQDSRKALQLAETTAWLMAVELLELGVDFSFAPVADLDYGINDVIGDRAFHRDVDIVSALVNAWIRGMHKAGMACVAKHFPGHGGVVADSHISLPVDTRTYGDLLIDDLVPFQRAIEHGVNGIMTAHIVYQENDPQPATFSKFWLQKVLRAQLGFRGAIFSDDLSMGAVCEYGDVLERVGMAIQAGCDMVLICNCPADAQLASASLRDPLGATSLSRLLPFHGKLTRGPDYRSHKEAAVRQVSALQAEAVVQLDLE